MVPDLRPRVCVPSSDTDTWTEASCAATFEALAGLSCFEHYPQIGPGLDYIELTRDEFIRWLEMREFSFPEFWKRPIDRVASLKQASEAVIVKAIKDVYDIARARGEKAPNIKELPGKVRDLLKTKGYTAAVRRIQQMGDNPEFKGCRRKPGKNSEQRATPRRALDFGSDFELSHCREIWKSGTRTTYVLDSPHLWSSDARRHEHSPHRIIPRSAKARRWAEN